jgi:hypothetical protein
MCWCDMLWVCQLINVCLRVARGFTCPACTCSSSRAPTSADVSTSFNFNLSLFLSPGAVCKAAMATSMDIDGTALGQPATLHGVRNEQPIIHTGLPLSNSRLPISISVRFGDCCSARLDPCHNSGSQNREPFREIPVKVHIRRPERDSWVYVGRATVSLDTTGHSSQVGESPTYTPFATLDRSSEL